MRLFFFTHRIFGRSLSRLTPIHDVPEAVQGHGRGPDWAVPQAISWKDQSPEAMPNLSPSPSKPAYKISDRLGQCCENARVAAVGPVLREHLLSLIYMDNRSSMILIPCRLMFVAFVLWRTPDSQPGSYSRFLTSRDRIQGSWMTRF